eukprot:Gregarina_sp_Poly_1__10467@NODE_761_length_6399_cov_244_304169_g561_i0_p7_GENE_NODE_761_length_6399_cov_244_304169_g561_i0NODE_761_length_6399_cov_244_304169_g561_i0_p7_ORF_typecomplete_len106_score19_93QueF_N/PF14819_6/0_17_NODE_761_length_6399_cov_244_304169_g561_i046654982
MHAAFQVCLVMSFLLTAGASHSPYEFSHSMKKALQSFTANKMSSISHSTSLLEKDFAKLTTFKMDRIHAGEPAATSLYVKEAEWIREIKTNPIWQKCERFFTASP